MSYNDTLKTNNADLQAILDAVNALPEAGSDSGSGSVETCNITVSSNIRGVCYVTTYDNGVVTYTSEHTPATFENVIKNSVAFVYLASMLQYEIDDSSGSNVYVEDYGTNFAVLTVEGNGSRDLTWITM